MEAINNYIEKNLSKINSYPNAIEALNKLNYFLIENEYFLSPDLIIQLIKTNKIINQLLNLITSENLYDILNANDFIILLIEYYCMINNIKINDYNYGLGDIETTDSVKIYLKEINRYPLLSEKEEKMLAYLIRNGDEKAKKRFIESNLRLVANIAKRYIGHGVPYLDLIEEGNIGLLKAVDKFDVTLGYRFSTYAHLIIRNKIIRSLPKQGRTIELTFDEYDKLKNFELQCKALERKLGKIPTVKEISEALQIEIDEVRTLQKLQAPLVSLNSETLYETASIELISSTREETIEEKVTNTPSYPEIEDLLNNCDLSEREKNILLLRFGFLASGEKTLKEISEIEGVSFQDVSVTIERAIRKIRENNYLRPYAIYMDYPDVAINNIDKFIIGYKEERIIKYLSNRARRKKEEVDLSLVFKDSLRQIREILKENPSLMKEEEAIVLVATYNCNVSPKIVARIMNYRELEVREILKRVLSTYQEVLSTYMGKCKKLVK